MARCVRMVREEPQLRSPFAHRFVYRHPIPMTCSALAIRCPMNASRSTGIPGPDLTVPLEFAM
jgi:hypothetical protein